MSLSGRLDALFAQTDRPLPAITLRLLWLSPLLLVAVVGALVGSGPGDWLYDWGLPLAALVSASLFGVAMYRWYLAYGRTRRPDDTPPSA